MEREDILMLSLRAAYLDFLKALRDTCKPGLKIDYGWYPLLKEMLADWRISGQTDFPNRRVKHIGQTLAKVYPDTCEFRTIFWSS